MFTSCDNCVDMFYHQMKQNKERWPVFDNSHNPHLASIQEQFPSSQRHGSGSDIFEEMSGMVTLRRKGKGEGHSPSPGISGLTPPPLPPPNLQLITT